MKKLTVILLFLFVSCNTENEPQVGDKYQCENRKCAIEFKGKETAVFLLGNESYPATYSIDDREITLVVEILSEKSTLILKINTNGKLIEESGGGWFMFSREMMVFDLAE